MQSNSSQFNPSFSAWHFVLNMHSQWHNALETVMPLRVQILHFKKTFFSERPTFFLKRNPRNPFCWKGLDWIGLDWTDWIGLDWTGLDRIRLDWIGLNGNGWHFFGGGPWPVHCRNKTFTIEIYDFHHVFLMKRAMFFQARKFFVFVWPNFWLAILFAWLILCKSICFAGVHSRKQGICKILTPSWT